MRTIQCGLVASLLLACAGATAATPDIEAIWTIVQQQQAEIDELKRRLEVADAKLENAELQIEATGDYVESVANVPQADSTTRIGGYGELHYNNLNADDNANDVDEIDFHRFVLFFGHDFTDRVRFFSELELEHSLAGDGAPGEVELEQAFIEFGLTDTVSAKTGLFLLPLGTINETHEPPTFYGVERNSVENVIIPTTWWEAGAALSGYFANGLSWDVAAHSGLAIPTTGGSAFRVRSGRQKVAEALASDPAYTLRLRYTGLPGLDLSASYQYQSDPSQVAGDGLDSGRLFTANAGYTVGGFSLRSLYARWDFSGDAVELADSDSQAGWYIEPSYRFPGVSSQWGIYSRYEDVEGARTQDRYSQWEVGFSYWPIDDVVLKFDYRSRDHDLAVDGGRDFDGFDLGVGYQF